MSAGPIALQNAAIELHEYGRSVERHRQAVKAMEDRRILESRRKQIVSAVEELEAEKSAIDSQIEALELREQSQ